MGRSFRNSVTLTFVTKADIVIRKATLADLPASARLISGHESGDIEDWQSRFEQDLANPQRLFLVATIDNVLVGYGHTTFHTRPSDGEVNESPTGYFLSGVMVSPDHRRQGVGTLLTTARIDELRRVADMVYYLAESDNQATIHMHARLGFEKIGSVERNGRGLVVFSLELSAPS